MHNKSHSHIIFFPQTQHKKNSSTSSFSIPYHLIVWGYSIATTLILVFTDRAAPSLDDTCWVAKDDLFVLTIFIPLLFYFFLSLTAAIMVAVRGKYFFDGDVTINRQLRLRMVMFLCVFIFSWSGHISHYIAAFMTEYDRSFDFFFPIFFSDLRKKKKDRMG